MDLEDKFLVKGSCVQRLSLNAPSSPCKNGNPEDASTSPEHVCEFPRSGIKVELIGTCFEKDRKRAGSSLRSKMTEVSKKRNRGTKKQEARKATANAYDHVSSSKKKHRKGENPARIFPLAEKSPDFASSNTWICRNSACRAVISIDDTFCRRCSCCICHLFDDNKDPSLWLVCTSEMDQEDSCGLSCHMECALQRSKVGVVDLGQLMQLDGSYCCASCGKVSGIIECWKKQLLVAKDARRVDVLCHRIHLCYRLLDGTSRFKELHQIVKDVKEELEREMGSVLGASTTMARGIVSRLSNVGDIQKLCSLAIDKADAWLAAQPHSRAEGSLPSACRFIFEEVTSSSALVILIESPKSSSIDVEGYKLWYWRSGEETAGMEAFCEFPRTQRRVLVLNLQPCTEYTFRVVSYSEDGEMGHSEAKCFTKSKEILYGNLSSFLSKGGRKDNLANSSPTDDSRDGFKVRDLGKILHLPSAPHGADAADVKHETDEDPLPLLCGGLDLNATSLPDLNEDLAVASESCRNFYDAHLVDHDGAEKSHDRTSDSQTWAHGPAREVPADSDSTLVNASPLRVCHGSGNLDANFEYCVRTVRWLECEGYVTHEFRLKLLTWFSLRSTEQERRVMNTFIQTLIDDPASLAGQLVDSFSDIISNKRMRNGLVE